MKGAAGEIIYRIIIIILEAPFGEILVCILSFIY
jgi:hypothetical protein